MQAPHQCRSAGYGSLRAAHHWWTPLTRPPRFITVVFPFAQASSIQTKHVIFPGCHHCTHAIMSSEPISAHLTDHICDGQPAHRSQNRRPGAEQAGGPVSTTHHRHVIPASTTACWLLCCRFRKHHHRPPDRLPAASKVFSDGEPHLLTSAVSRIAFIHTGPPRHHF